VTEDGLWTLEQLSERVADALAEDYDGQPSGRVRELPTGRTIRWYTTIGLVDRPAEFRGRTAYYTRRHLLQLVAVKRLQAAGASLADVQERLVGATDRTLAELAGVGRSKTRTARFWAAAPSAAVDGDSDSVAAQPPLPIAVHGVRLTNGVTLLLDAATRAPDRPDLAAIQAAAAPLLDLLSHLGLDHDGGEAS
jgi:DNA-binding transcriptional MerR regulator